MKQLRDRDARAALVGRLHRLRPDSPRQWGRMSPHQAVCHLSDSFRAMMDSVPIRSRSTLFMRAVGKWIAINSGLRWPHGVATVPEVDQEVGGTRPVDFARDLHELEVLVERFALRSSPELQAHPMFGRMSTDEWQRWGWIHMDHHLRQFGV